MPHMATLRESGGSVIVTVPRAVLEALGWSARSRVGLSIDHGRLVLERPRYTLDELLADFDPEAYREAAADWDRMAPVGREEF